MNMVHRLRRKFILMALIAVVIILTGALGLINVISYMKMESEVTTLLNVIAQNGGMMPAHQIPLPSESWSSWLNDPEWYNNTPEFAHQTRYFSAFVDETNGKVTQLNLTNISAFDQQEALEVIDKVLENQQKQGVFKKERASYAFLVSPQPGGDYMVVVMDCTRDVAAVEAFMRYSVRFGLICVLLYILVLSFLCNFAIQPFVENMENQKRFITNAGHELKTPIAIISANAEAMELLNGKSQWTDNILMQVKRLTRLINELIMLAKMGEKSQSGLTLKDVDVSALFTDAVKAFSPLVEGEKKKLVLDIPPDIRALSEEKYLYEVFTILMDNAAKYCDDEGTIWAVLTRNGKHGFKAAVSNSYKEGEGVDYNHFFERFYRGDESHNSKKAGYGIGLSMAEEVMNLLGGQLKVTFDKGVITFTVQFS